MEEGLRSPEVDFSDLEAIMREWFGYDKDGAIEPKLIFFCR